MPAMSLPNAKRTGKRISFFNDQGLAMKEGAPHPEGPYYGLGAAPAPEGAQSEAASTVQSSNPAEAPHMYLNSVIFSPEKGDQSRGHYQQTVPMKWAHQDPSPQHQQRAGSWTQGVATANWGQNFAPYLGGVSVSDTRAQTLFTKQVREGATLQQQPPGRAPEKQKQQQQLVVPGPGEAYREVAKTRGLDWDQQQQHQALPQSQQQHQHQAPPQQPPQAPLQQQQHQAPPQQPHQAPPQQQQHQAPPQQPHQAPPQQHQHQAPPQQQHQAPPQQQTPPQSFQQPLKPGALNAQQLSTQNPGGSSVLQPFQLAFGQPKQHLTDYYQAFQGNRTLPNLNYPPQAKSQHQQLQQLQQQKEQLQRQQHLLQQQQQIQQQHHQMHQQQILQHQQHIQQQLQQQQQQQHIQQQQQQQIHQEQQQIDQQQNIQQQQQQQQIQQQQIQQQQLQHKQQMQQQHIQQQQLQQQNQHLVEYYPGSQNAHPPPLPQPPVLMHSQEPVAPALPEVQDPDPPAVPPDPEPDSDPQPLQVQPRRSRRLSKEGGAPLGDNPFLLPSEQGLGQGPQNGGPPETGRGPPRTEELQAAPTGVIQSTRRKRRVSQEVNLETLAQKASEMESLPSHNLKEPHRPWSPSRAAGGPGVRVSGDPEGLSAKRPRDDSLLPLVMPVSVPVRRPDAQPPSSSSCSSSSGREQAEAGPGWSPRPLHLDGECADHKPSVIVTRRRSLRNSPTESLGQNGGPEGDRDDDGKSAKSKRRPRPEPLFIPPPKPGTFITPALYSSVTPYQSHLRSPVRLVDHPLAMPPYTPPPILSPVREGSGLYFSTFLSSSASASTQGLPPPITPKSATRSLLRSNSCDITPPVLSLISEATPVSIEPRINIGGRYQAEVPELRQRAAVQDDQHRAELVSAPLPEADAQPGYQERVEDLMHLACSSALCGGGTNQELAQHCLYECKGDIMGALALLLLKTPIFPKSHHLGDYHYSGSDSWSAAERRSFNKGITAYKKDFFMVQKLVGSKTVAQCVEFYYTYKKHVKIGRNGALLYGEAEPVETRAVEEELDQKTSHRLTTRKEEEDNRRWEGSADRTRDSSGGGPGGMKHAAQQAAENTGAVPVLKSQEEVRREQPSSRVSHPPPPSKTRADGAARKPVPAAAKPPAGQEGEFPCKKCGRVFFKVKSRSAHMKSHAEQEKKAAALRQREAEERAAAQEAQAQAEAQALAALQNGGGALTGGVAAGDSTNEDSSGDDDEDRDGDDEDWH